MVSSNPKPPKPDPELAAVAQDYWEALLHFSPATATYFGDRRNDDRLDDRSPAAVEAQLRRLGELRERIERIDASALRGEDTITHAALLGELRRDAALLEADLTSWSVDVMAGPQGLVLALESLQPITTPDEGRRLVERWRAMGPYMDRAIEGLRRRLEDGTVAVRTPLAKVIDQLDGVLAQPDRELPLLAPAQVEHPEWSSHDLAAFRDALTDATARDARPALERYRDVLRDEILPAARPDERPGIAHVEGGRAAYDLLIEYHTSLTLTAEEIHAIGLEEVAAIDAALSELGGRVLGTSDLAEIQARLRGDRAMHFATRDEVREVAQRSLARAEAAVPDWFGIQPKAPCVVVVMPQHEEAHSTIAYYRQPAIDGSRPGQYFINTGSPETRPRYEAEALGFHEAVPGHHLQLAISQELTDLPAFRRNGGTTAFIEGWGLYAERLSDEMGLYSGDVDHLGVLSYDAWRACRLVVDTGIHALGWTRQAAIDFMLAHTALAPNNIVNEVDRYIVEPGQALAYKLGQRELFRLRGEAQRRLGPRFDIRAFHDTVLGHGGVALDTLGTIVEEWLTGLEAT
jgi:uncharacterized protein (DUF885 family)